MKAHLGKKWVTLTAMLSGRQAKFCAEAPFRLAERRLG